MWTSASLKSADAAVSGLVGVRSGVEEGEQVLGLRERLVERLLGDADRAEHLLDLGRVVDASDCDRELVARRGLDRQRVADRQVLVVGVRLRHERAIGAELGDGGVGAVGPVELVEARDRRRVHAGDVLLLARHERLVDADVRVRR